MKHLAIYGACGGVLIVAMRFVEYRFLVVSHSVEIYAALLAATFAAIGIWLGLSITGRKTVIREVVVPVVSEAPQGGLFVADSARIAALGLTPRELEVLELIAEGLSNKEMAGRLFVYFGIRSYRDNVLGGRISFAKGFQAGILITLTSCLFYVGAWMITYPQFFPDFADKYAAYLVEDQRASGASQAEIESTIKQGDEMKRMLDNPLINAAVTFTEPFPVGLLVTLISAAVLRTQEAA